MSQNVPNKMLILSTCGKQSPMQEGQSSPAGATLALWLPSYLCVTRVFLHGWPQQSTPPQVPLPYTFTRHCRYAMGEKCSLKGEGWVGFFCKGIGGDPERGWRKERNILLERGWRKKRNILLERGWRKERNILLVIQVGVGRHRLTLLKKRSVHGSLGSHWKQHGVVFISQNYSNET